MEAMNPDENKDYTALVKGLGFSNAQLSQVANFTNNKYPDIELKHEVEDEDEIRSNEPTFIKVTIQQNIEEDDEFDPTVHAPFYTGKKIENWWLVVGEESTKSLLSIKRVTIMRELEVKLDFTVPTAGKHDLKLYLMSDSYRGVDQETEFSITAAEGMDVDSDSETEDSE